MSSIPWRTIVLTALLGTLAVIGLVLQDVATTGGRNPVSIVNPGTAGPSARVIQHDFPEVALPDGVGHDGQQFYAIARAPMHPTEVAENLDRPRYRLQRPLLPLLGWILHPTGGGAGLIWAMFAVNAAALLAAGIAAGVLSVTWRGPTWVAAVVPLLPIGYASVRISVADLLAMALVLAALAADTRDRTLLATGLATGAVLAKESILLVLLGWWVSRRTHSAAAMLGAASATAATWWLVLRLTIDAAGESVIEFGAPFRGLVESAGHWTEGDQLLAAVTLIGTVAAAVAALRRRRGHPLNGAILVSLLFLIPLNANVLGLDFNGSRTLGPLCGMSLIALVAPGPGTSSSPKAAGAAR